MDVNALTASTPNDPTEAIFTPAGGELGKDEFLTLLIAQLTNQDPLSPLEGTDLAVQLAQFSSVEQLMQLNENLQGQFAINGQIARALSSSTSAGLIGREVIALGDRLDIGDQGSASVTFRISGAGEATLKVLDENGATVTTQSLGNRGAGRYDESLDFPGVAAGSYRYVVEIADADGTVTQAQTFLRGLVSGLRFEEGRTVLLVGGDEVPIEDVIEVTIAGSGNTSETP